MRCELRVVAVVVGVPQFDLRPGEPVAAEVGDLAGEDERGDLLVLGTHRQGARGRQFRRVLDVVRALDAALGALAGAGEDLFDGVLDEHVEEQRPLAALADVDQPLLEHAVFGVGDAVLEDHVVERAEGVLGDRREPLGRGVGADALGLELVGGGGADPAAVGLSVVVIVSPRAEGIRTGLVSSFGRRGGCSHAGGSCICSCAY